MLTLNRLIQNSFRAAGVAFATVAVSGCAHLIEPWPNAANESVLALTTDGSLIRVHATNPWEVRDALPLRGLPVG